MTRVNGVQNKHGVKTPGKKREALSAAEKSREKIESIALPGVAAPKSTAAPAALPYAMGRDTYTPASPYAAGLQARQAIQTPKSVKTDVPQPAFTQRAADTVSGGLKSTAASMTNMVGTLREMGQPSRDKQNQKVIEDYALTLDYAQRALDAALEDLEKDSGAWTQGDIQSFYNARDDARRKYDAIVKVYGSQAQKGTLQGTYEAADKLQLSSAQDIARAKEGLGIPGQMLVDAGASMAQMAGDAVGGALTGSGMIPLAMRAFGGGAQQARQDGADLKGQVGYGAAIAAKEYVTEKMFGIALPFSQIYGGGAMDDAVERVIQKAVGKLASSPQGQKVVGGLMTLVASGVTEGLEDLVGDWLEWQMPRIYGGDTDSATETLGNSLYDFGVSFIAGLAGEALSIGRHTGVDEDTAAQLRQTAEEMSGVKQGAEVVKAQKTAPMERAESVRVGRATIIQNPYEGATPTYIRPETQIRPKIMEESVAEAQARIEQTKQQGQQEGKSFRNFLTDIYETVFAKSGGSRGVGVDGLFMDGEPYVVDINKSAIGKIIWDANMSAEKLAIIDVIDDVIKSGEYVGSGKYIQKGKKKKHTIRFDYFETPVMIGGQPFIVAFDVEVFPAANNYRTHKVINEMDLIPQDRTDTGTLPPQGLTRIGPSTNFIIPSSGDGVKGEYAPESGEDILAQAAQEVAGDGTFPTVRIDPGARKTIRGQVAQMPSADYQIPHISMPEEAMVGEDGHRVSESKMPSAIRRYMAKLFRGKVLNIGKDHKVYIDKDGVEEYAFPAKRISGEIRTAKLTAGANLDTTLGPAQFLKNGVDDGHHPEATGGWDYFYVMFETDTGIYSGIVNTKVTERGRVFHDITEIQKESGPSTRGVNGEPPPPAKTDPLSSAPIICPSGDGVKGEYAPESGEDILAQAAQKVAGDGTFPTEQLDLDPTTQRIQQEVMQDTLHGVDEDTAAQLRQTAEEMSGVAGHGSREGTKNRRYGKTGRWRKRGRLR